MEFTSLPLKKTHKNIHFFFSALCNQLNASLMNASRKITVGNNKAWRRIRIWKIKYQRNAPT